MQCKNVLVIIIGILLFLSIPLQADNREQINKINTYEDKRAVPNALAIGDINKDNSPEILFASTDSQLIILDEKLFPGEPIISTCSIVRKILLSDLDGDSNQDIIAIDSTTLYVFNEDSTEKFKHVFEGEVFDIAVGDLDDDDLDELLVGTSNGLDRFDWDGSTYKLKPYIDKSISEIIYFDIKENKNPYIIAKSLTNIYILTWNGGHQWELEYKEILEISYLEDYLVVLGKKDNQSEPCLWKFSLKNRIDSKKRTEINFYNQYPIEKVFFAHYGESDLLTVYIKNLNSLVSINLEGEENWRLSISPISVELFDLDNYKVKGCSDENYNEIIITSPGRISVYIYCWKKGENNEYQSEMIPVEEYQIIEGIRETKVFDYTKSFGKGMLIITDEGELILYEIFHRYNVFLSYYKGAIEMLDGTEPDYNYALDKFDACIKNYIDIANYYGIKEEDINKKRQICLEALGEDKEKMDKMLEESLLKYGEDNYKVAVEGLSKVYAFYRLMNTKDDEIIYDNFTFSELRSTLRQAMAELFVEINGYYSDQNYLSALESLSYLEEGIDESGLGIDRERIPETLEIYDFLDHREKFLEKCINQLETQAENHEKNEKLKDALKIWKKIEEAYSRLGYTENQNRFKYENDMKPVLGKIEDIEAKISQKNREILIIIVIISIIVLGICIIKFTKKETRKKLMKRLISLIKTLSNMIIENEKSRNIGQEEKLKSEEKFITLNHEDFFYQRLEEEINTCYAEGAYTAAFVMSRKLIENLLIEVLREKYGEKTEDDVRIYFETSKGRFQNFSKLLDNLEDRKKDFEIDKNTIEEFFKLVKPFKKGANRKAHSIVDTFEKKEELKKFEVPKLASLLMRLFKNIKE